MELSGRRLTTRLLFIAVLYYAGAKLGLAFAVLPEVLVIVWIPNSILLAAFLHYGGRQFPLLAASVIAAEIAADYGTFPLLQAALFGAINVLEISVAWLLLRKWRFDPRFAAPNDLATFVISGPVIAAFLSACCAAAVYRLFGDARTHLFEIVRVWWFGNGLGLLILTPLVLSLWPPLPPIPDAPAKLRWWDALALAASAIVAVGFAFTHQRMVFGLTVRAFLLIPPVLYVAARFSARTTTASVAAVAALILLVTERGGQPFGDVPMSETVLSAQELIFIIAIMALGIAALLSQHRADVRELEGRVAERTRQLERLAVTDPLTGVLNRRALFDLLKREIERAKRYGHAAAVIEFDIDHFKAVNDRYGHAAGDEVLRHVAQVVSGALRNSDAIARYGGEEFVVVAPETDSPSAIRLAERLRGALRASEVAMEGTAVRVTASFGVAMLRPDESDAEPLLRRVDAALYAAKSAGRDCVVA